MTTNFLIYNFGPGDLSVLTEQHDAEGNVSSTSNQLLKPRTGTQVYCYRGQSVIVDEVADVLS